MKKAKPKTGGRMSLKAKDIDDYLAHFPADQRQALQRLRKIINTVAPDSTEAISYGVPVFKHYGMLVGFAAFKEHCSFFIMSVKATRAHADDLKGYDLATATIRFRPEKPLPVRLVTKLVKARMAENEAKRGPGKKPKR